MRLKGLGHFVHNENDISPFRFVFGDDFFRMEHGLGDAVEMRGHVLDGIAHHERCHAFVVRHADDGMPIDFVRQVIKLAIEQGLGGDGSQRFFADFWRIGLIVVPGIRHRYADICAVLGSPNSEGPRKASYGRRLSFGATPIAAGGERAP